MTSDTDRRSIGLVATDRVLISRRPEGSRRAGDDANPCRAPTCASRSAGDINGLSGVPARAVPNG